MNFENDKKLNNNSIIYNYNDDDSMSKNISPHIIFCGDIYCYSEYSQTFTEPDCFLFLYTIDGFGEIYYNNKYTHICAGSLIIIDCNKNNIINNYGNDWHFNFFIAKGLPFKNLCNQLFYNNYYFLNSILAIISRDSFKNIFANDSIPKIERNISNSMLATNILLTAYQNFNKENTIKNANILKIETHIKNNFLNDMSLDSLCSKFGYSKSYFIKFFKKSLGITPFEYIIKLKICYAKDLLLNTNDSIDEIALKLKYDSSSNFVRAFKNVTGLTPTKFRPKS